MLQTNFGGSVLSETGGFYFLVIYMLPHYVKLCTGKRYMLTIMNLLYVFP